MSGSLLYADSSTQARSNAQDSCSYAPIMQYYAKVEMQRCNIAMHLGSKHVPRALLPKHSCCRRDKLIKHENHCWLLREYLHVLFLPPPTFPPFKQPSRSFGQRPRHIVLDRFVHVIEDHGITLLGRECSVQERSPLNFVICSTTQLISAL